MNQTTDDIEEDLLVKFKRIQNTLEGTEKKYFTLIYLSGCKNNLNFYIPLNERRFTVIKNKLTKKKYVHTNQYEIFFKILEYIHITKCIDDRALRQFITDISIDTVLLLEPFLFQKTQSKTQLDIDEYNRNNKNHTISTYTTTSFTTTIDYCSVKFNLFQNSIGNVFKMSKNENVHKKIKDYVKTHYCYCKNKNNNISFVPKSGHLPATVLIVGAEIKELIL